MAVLLRGGMLPQASVYPADMRAPRARRRRRPLRRTRAERLTHLHNTTRPYTLPEIGKQRADTANRAGVAERCSEPAGPQRIAVALALLGSDAPLRRDRAGALLQTATQHQAPTLY
jgi:hypothetical protein